MQVPLVCPLAVNYERSTSVIWKNKNKPNIFLHPVTRRHWLKSDKWWISFVRAFQIKLSFFFLQIFSMWHGSTKDKREYQLMIHTQTKNMCVFLMFHNWTSLRSAQQMVWLMVWLTVRGSIKTHPSAWVLISWTLNLCLPTAFTLTVSMPYSCSSRYA